MFRTQNVICMTNRALCSNFLQRIEEIAAQRPSGIILREKDMSETNYRKLAAQVMEICKTYTVPCILHSFPDTAAVLDAIGLHLPMPLLRSLPLEQRVRFFILGASVHSVEEAVMAEEYGCKYLTAGHIFATDCKKGVSPRGLDFLHDVCAHVQIPVYAIGGIDSSNFTSIMDAGAAGACIMSGLMQCEDVPDYMGKLRKLRNQYET
ncbi:MAG: thiamine phosphate synthase [Oscillospiraceae bacterium]|nr:thiamine phosphate synthase [Oscillospiraceae bacterium]